MEKYADHSKEVWEASKVVLLSPPSFPKINCTQLIEFLQFWKQFFEASANVSLSSYQEPTPEDTTITEDTTQMTPSSSTPTSPSEVLQDPNQTPLNKRNDHSREADEPDLTSTPSNMTPRAKIASYSSPYEALKREVQGQPPLEDDFTSSTLSSTPRAQPALQSSPFHPPSTTHSATTAYRTPANDVLLHRILDKNWRIQATPHLQPKLLHHQGGKASETPLPSTRKRRPLQPSAAANDSLDSSPMLPAPELRTDIFSSPLKQPRIPGISILTPARQKANLKADPTLHDPNLNTATWAFDSDSDTSSPQGISPPKTMQFHIPQSRLLKTPGQSFFTWTCPIPFLSLSSKASFSTTPPYQRKS